MTDVTTGEAGEPGLSVPVPGDLLGVLVDRRRGGDWGYFNTTHGYKDQVPG